MMQLFAYNVKQIYAQLTLLLLRLAGGWLWRAAPFGAWLCQGPKVVAVTCSAGSRWLYLSLHHLAAAYCACQRCFTC